MKMFITMCGRQQKLSVSGDAHGWHSTVFCTTERFFSEAVFGEAEIITKDVATQKIREQVLKLNPVAQDKKITKFILG